MRLIISHKTTYHYDTPVPYGLQQLRLHPKTHGAQRVINWDVNVSGGKKELSFEDEHSNHVDLVSFTPHESDFSTHCYGEVEVDENPKSIEHHNGFMPLWFFERQTALTKVGPLAKELLASLPNSNDILDRMHRLSNHVLTHMPYSTDQTLSDLTAEEALAAGHGVCQDHAHVFITLSRMLGVPARYVSGYLMMNDRVEQDATHAWAEAYIPYLGWTGFDISNGYSPDARYVRIATGLDYRDAAPISGLRFGTGAETLNVSLQVQQQ